MIWRFRAIIPAILYRGSAPNDADVEYLQQHFGIKKIVSLDKVSGDKIDNICKKLGIEHIHSYIDMNNRQTLIRFLSQDFKKVFLENGPTFLHCMHGRNRSSLASAIIECKYLHKTPNQAIEEADKMGMSQFMDSKISALYKRIIQNCKPATDSNSVDDIVSHEREYKSDNRDSFLDEARMSSFAPYLDPTRIYPYTDNGDTRPNYKETPIIPQAKPGNTTPLVGLFNNDAGLGAAGPTINMTGFLYD